MEGFGLRVELNVEGCPDDALIQAAHEVRISQRSLFADLLDICCSFALIVVL